MSRIHSPRYKEERRKKNIRWSIFSGVLAILIFSGSIWLIRSEKFLIKSVTVSDTRFVSALEVETLVQDFIKGNYLFVYPKSSVILYPSAAINKSVVSSFPSVTKVILSINRSGDSAAVPALHVDLWEREPFMQWCADEKTDSCFVLDSSGYIFAPAPLFSHSKYPIIYGGINRASSTTDNPIRQKILDQDSFKSLVDFSKNLEAFGFTINKYQINTEPVDPSCKLFWTETSYILAQCGGDHAAALRDIQAIISDNRFGTSTIMNYSHIDLRLPGKVIYKAPK